MPDPATKLNNLQYGALNRVRAGGGRWWPSDRSIASLCALENRGMVAFARGYGWRMLPEGDAALDRYIAENPHAFDEE